MLLLGVYQLLGDLSELVPGLRRAADALGLKEVGVVEEGDRAALDRQVVLLATPLLMEGGGNVREELRRFLSDALIEWFDQPEIGEFCDPIDLDHEHVR